MKMKRLICSRNEHPDTCILCENEGNDYCMICADACTLEEMHNINGHADVSHLERKVLLSDCFTGAEVTVPQIY